MLPEQINKPSSRDINADSENSIENAMLCLLAGKHVLCEKAFTTNAAQTKKLRDS